MTKPVVLEIFMILFEKSISELMSCIFKLFALIKPFEILKKPVDLIFRKFPFMLKSAYNSPSIESILLYFEKSINGLIFLYASANLILSVFTFKSISAFFECHIDF